MSIILTGNTKPNAQFRNRVRDEAEEKALKTALDNAVQFAASYRKGKDLVYDKAQLRKEKKLKKLQAELKESKKQVVRHLVKCNAIEKSILQSKVTNEAIRRHVSTRPVGKNENGTKAIRDVWKESNTKYLGEKDLTKIESIPSITDPSNAFPLVPSSAFALQRSLASYDDSFLTYELENFPSCQVDAVNVQLFSKIAWVSSSKHISLSEARAIYMRGNARSQVMYEYMSRNGGNSATSMSLSELRWKILKRMLRNKLRLQYLAVELSKLEKKASISSNSNTMLLKPTRISKTSSEKIFSKSLDFDHSKLSLPELSNQLERSQERQQNLRSKISSNISLVSRSVPLGSLSSASHYSKRMGGKKMYSIFCLKLKGFWKLGFEKLKNHVRVCKLEVVCAHFLKAYAAHRYYYVAASAIHNKMQRRFDDWKAKLSNLKALEEYASVVEIQRVVRGKKSRLYVKCIHRHRAATQVQRIARYMLAKMYVARLKDAKRLKEAVLFIECSWKKNIWRRTLKNLFKLRKQTIASGLILRVYRGHRGRKVARARRRMAAEWHGALKMQCLWRRYRATVLVDEYYSKWKQVEGSKSIQRIVRGVQGRRKAREYRVKKEAAECIQRGYRCRRARKIFITKKIDANARRIQRIMRGKVARNRVAQLRKRKAQEAAEHAHAFAVVEMILLGHVIRKRIGDKLEKHKKARAEAARTIKERFRAVQAGNRDRNQLLQRKKRANIIARAMRRYLDRKNEQMVCAVIVQSAVRRHLAKRVLRERQEQFLIDMKKRKLYYRLKSMYFSDQEAFHGSKVRLIQSVWRGYYAKKHFDSFRRLHLQNAAAREIQRAARSYHLRLEAKKTVKELRHVKHQRKNAALNIQRVGRGRIARHQYRKHRHSDIVKWFLSEARAVTLTRQIFHNFKERKKTLMMMNAAATKFQSLVRGVQGRCKVRKIHKRLVRNREKVVKRKRETAALRIQAVARRLLAKKTVRIRQKEWEEREAKRKQLEELDTKLDGLHENHLNDLLVLRVQQGVRGNQARKHRQLQAERLQRERQQREEDQRLLAIRTIQAFARGIRGRRKFHEQLPELKKQLRARSFCIECEIAPATRKCRVCREQFCDVCFANVHRKGNRKKHAYDLIRKGDDDVGETDKFGESNPLLWEEQWDENAQARYWYHSLTGEATWINPFE